MRRLTSARFGTFFSVTVSEVRRLAIIRGRAAFLAPLIGIVPVRRCPPVIRILSMMSAGNECFGARPKAAHAPVTLDERSLHRNLEAACHSRHCPHSWLLLCSFRLARLRRSAAASRFFFSAMSGFSPFGSIWFGGFSVIRSRKLCLNAPKRRVSNFTIGQFRMCLDARHARRLLRR